MISSYLSINSGVCFILLIRDFSLPNANSLFSGRHDLSSFHGQLTLYLSFSNFSVSLKSWCALALSESFGESVIPIASRFQKSSMLGFIGNDLSGVGSPVSLWHW